MSIRTAIRTAALAAVALVAASPLRAQLDPRLQAKDANYKPGTTDLLDVYQTSGANPELLTIYDFSGSMHAVYWSKYYWTNAAQTTHSDQWGAKMYDYTNKVTVPAVGEFPGIVPLLDSAGHVYLAAGTGYYQSVYNTTGIGYNDYTRPPSSIKIQWPNCIDNSGSGQLIAPDGSVVTVSGGNLAAAVQKASHIRITATATIDGSAVTRTVDLPIPWVVLDETNTSTNDASTAKKIYTDPAGGPSMPPDIVSDPNPPATSGVKATSSSSQNLINGGIQDSVTGKTYYKIGRFHYTRDYLWWVFFGTTVRDTTTNAGEVDAGGYAVSDSTAAPAWKNGLSGVTRYQALKEATLVAWFANQSNVWWGVRFLDGNEDTVNTSRSTGSGPQTNAQNGNNSTPQTDRNINLFRKAQNGNVNSMLAAFVAFEPNGGTPLVSAMANAYMQLAYTSDAGSSFGTSQSGGGASGTESPIPACRKSFVVVFTDGIANDTLADGTNAIGTADPYHQDINGKVTNTRTDGNTAVAGYGGLSALSPGSPMFNIWTLAGVAAQYSTPDKWLGPGDTKWHTIASYAPWRITNRGASNASPRKIRTMTVGMSLAGSTKDVASGKADLFRAALYGNPDASTWDLTNHSYLQTPDDTDPSVNPFFFDAYSREALSSAMTAVLAEVTSGSASIAAPASPLVGLSLGNQVYLGLFQTVKSPRWLGDLLMAGLYLGPQGTAFIDKNGNAVTSITDENAVWSAAQDVFGSSSSGRNWLTRNLFTNFNASTHSSNTTTLVKLDEDTLTTAADVGAADDATRKAYIRFLRGASLADQTPADPTFTGNRPDIMGDIINSSPAVLEYPVSTDPDQPNALTSTVSSYLAGKLSDVPSGSTPHFRVIFVGDNQGILHAFGELSWTESGTIKFITTTTTTNPDGTVTQTQTETDVPGQIPKGYVDEIWAFMPGEFLGNIAGQLEGKKLDYHVYTMDGSPTIYFKDVPASGQTRGDGLVEGSDLGGSDVVRVIVGEKKGGRSYYAFDFSNLDKVVSNTGSIMSWSLTPDTYSSSASVGSTSDVIRHMGFSTPTGALGRVDVGTSLNQDLVFFGGGLSTTAVDSAFAADGTFNDSKAKLGRSIVAFDAVAGPSTNLYTWDFRDTGTTTFGSAFGFPTGAKMGCIAAAVQPLEFFQGSGHTQRVYFADTPTDSNATALRGGGVWALGSTNLASNGIIRLDSSDITVWAGNAGAYTNQGLRHIFQTNAGWSITTTPTPFLLPGPYPDVRTSDPKFAPVAVGISFGTGDRNDPVDNDLINPGLMNTKNQITTAYNNWLNVIFDRQDSSSVSGANLSLTNTNIDKYGILQGVSATDGDVADLTTIKAFTGTGSTANGYSVDPTNSAFYLKYKLGYKLNMGTATAKDTTNTTYFYPKVITNTVVLNGVLFFSNFAPAMAVGSCIGSGVTNTYRICNVLQPTYNSGSTSASATSFNGGDPTCTGKVLTYPNLPGEITALGTAAVIQSGQGTPTNPDQAGTLSNAGAQVGGSVGKTSGFAFRPRSWRIIR